MALAQCRRMTGYELGTCPVCETKDFRQIADADAVKRQVEELWEFHTRRMKPGAPLKAWFDRTVFSQEPPIHIVECVDCGTVLRNPRETAEQVVDVYKQEETPATAFETLFIEQVDFFQSRVETIEHMLGRKGAVLEIGSYVGAFLHCATRNGWYAEGIDVNEIASEFARRKGCQVTTVEMTDYQSGREFDVIAIWNCLDQLPDPRATLTLACQHLKADGMLVMRVPNGAFYAMTQRLRLPSAMSAYNNMLGFPYRHGFTTTALHELVRAVGMRVMHLRGDTLAPLSAQWTQSWASVEQRAVRSITRLMLPRARMPWLEVYAHTL
jgi:2-polyprenyl-3-methyl-5-hydroxy-6-metoxy-1,4-benzoquinol methylase